jgi:hypothetical protein
VEPVEVEEGDGPPTARLEVDHAHGGGPVELGAVATGMTGQRGGAASDREAERPPARWCGEADDLVERVVSEERTDGELDVVAARVGHPHGEGEEVGVVIGGTEEQVGDEAETTADGRRSGSGGHGGHLTDGIDVRRPWKRGGREPGGAVCQ